MSLVSSILKMTCPRCRQGEMFTKPLKIAKPVQMHKRCSVCGQLFEPEIGFYYGAMFVSYVFIAFLSLIITGTLVFLLKVPLEISFLILIVFLAAIFFWNLKFSRSLWIHINIRYDPKYAAIKEDEKVN